ncbi:MAG: hypothetical protein ACRBCS_06575 [Cellvibrionaceae bacterium]
MRLLILALALVVSACSQEQTPSTPQTSEDIFVLIENGGTINEENYEDALDTSLNLLQQLTTLGRRKATRNSQIHIVLSALPNRIAWSGSANQLMEQAGQVKDLIVFKKSFSDLVMAFDQIETTINLTQPDHVRLYWVGTTIHVPFQETDAQINVEVPQEVPTNLALSNFSNRLSALKIYRVHPDQDQIFQAYLGSLGLLAKAKKGDLDFTLMGDAQTKSHLGSLL